MSSDDRQSSGGLEFPRNWDVIRDDGSDDESVAPRPGRPSEDHPPIIALVAASWADGVTTIAVCTAALVGLSLLGHQPTTDALPWALALGAAWWVAAAATLILIRRGSPGMLLAGVVFSERVAPRRVAVTVAAAAIQAVALGLPGMLGPRRSPLAVAAGSTMEIAAPR